MMTTCGLDIAKGSEPRPNITTRRLPKRLGTSNTKMAYNDGTHWRGMGETSDSILIDSILSKSEEDDVMRMLTTEGAMQEEFNGTNITSTQMNYRRPAGLALSMSPIMSDAYQNPSCRDRENESDIEGLGALLSVSNRFAPLQVEEALTNVRNNNKNGVGGEGIVCKGEVNNTGRALHDLDHQDATRVGEDGALLTGEVTNVDKIAGLSKQVKSNDKSDEEKEKNPTVDETVNVGEPGIPPSEGESDESELRGGQEGTEGEREGDDQSKTQTRDIKKMEDKLIKVDGILYELGTKSSVLTETVKSLRTSLEYSQQEIDMLKGENVELRRMLNDVEMEGKRSVYQMGKIEEKVDRVDTTVKKKNLIFEGVPETNESKENVEKSIWGLFDQLKINGEIVFDACYRQGAYNKNRTRPIVISFLKQADRDFVYASRMSLRKTQDYKHVWINEDLGQMSKKKRNIVRLISRKAQNENIDCRTGKYTIFVGGEKYDGSNMEDLPAPLHPSNVKQVQVDKDLIAYQSEYAPFSNLYPVHIIMGDYNFISLEQAYQYLKAKTLGKLLAATRIYLSRDQIDIKQMGDEIGTSAEWENKKFDAMYACMKRKFEQNPELLKLLLDSGDCELVEATPNRMWGCGATLSSNLLRRHEWPGDNKQGKILMTVREELRLSTTPKSV